MITTNQIYWLAGILEGEGTFSDETGSPRIQLKMTDRDIVYRAAMLLDKDAPIEKREFDDPRLKTIYTTRIHGNKTIQWMLTLYSIFGERRRARLKEIINNWRIRDRRDMGVDTCKRGHRLLKSGVDFRYSMNSNGSLSKKCVICQNLYNRAHPFRRKPSKVSI